MSGGGSSAPAQPSTTTQIQDIPAWEQGYVTNLLGQAQTIAAQPYQQFPGQQIAGFTPDQSQAFSNVEGQQANINPLQSAATGQSAAGANTANNIYGVGNPLINASTMPATPQGIQAYMSPYLNNDIAGLQTLAQQNWNQFTAPGVNNAFVSAGQSGSGRNEEVLGQQANLANQALTGQIASAINNAYSTAGNQAATEAGLLANAGNSLGNLAATQGQQQLSAGANLQNLAGAQNTNALNNNQALQAVGQQQQQLNQTNLNTAQQNWQNQVNWPATQTEYLNQIVRGLPAPSASTGSTQITPAYSVSPLSGIGGAGIGALALSGANGNPLGTATGIKTGGLIKGYAEGGTVDDEYGQTAAPEELPPLEYASETENNAPAPNPQSAPLTQPSPTQMPKNPLDISVPQFKGMSDAQQQQMQLLALARGMLTPSLGGNTSAAFGEGLGNLQEMQMAQQKTNMQQQQANFENQVKKAGLAQEQEKIEQGRYTPVKDFYGNVTGMVEGKTGKFTPVNTSTNPANVINSANEEPSSDPQKAALQIMAEQGTVPTPVMSRQDITGRNKQVEAYNNAALAAKSTIQQLNSLDAQTGKYTPGKVANIGYGAEAAIGQGGEGATARTEADKASKALANSFMQANVGAKGSGIRMVQFDAGAVPNADMPDDARTALVAKNKAIANSQIQRAAISNLYPHMNIANVNAIMDNYEEKNPPIMPDGNANPKWMPYQDWLKAGRPNTASLALKGDSGNPSPQAKPSGKIVSQADIAETAKNSGKSIAEVTKAVTAKGYTIQ